MSAEDKLTIRMTREERDVVLEMFRYLYASYRDSMGKPEEGSAEELYPSIIRKLKAAKKRRTKQCRRGN